MGICRSCIKVIIVYLFLVKLCSAYHNCSGFTSVGYTYPIGDITLEYNTSAPLEIICVITDKALIRDNPDISTQLYFKDQNRNITDAKIIRLNSTSIKLVMEKPKKMIAFYQCQFEQTTICLNSISVGTKPQPVTDFSCIGHNWENLTCSWTPSMNYITTNYSLTFTFPDKPKNKFDNCSIIRRNDTNKQECFISHYTKLTFRQTEKIYNFTLTANNAFGTLQQNFLFNHYKNIVPNPPENLRCRNATTSSLFLTWNVPNVISQISTGLEHRILYLCSFGPRTWQNGGIIESNGTQTHLSYNLTGFKYAHDLCDIRVSTRVKGVELESLWSANASVMAATGSTIPGAPPKVNIGSFQTDITSNSNRDIFVYWQQIPREIRNADNFRYSIDFINKDEGTLHKAEVTDSFAKFTNMSITDSYKAEIRSRNSIGYSLEIATLEIPTDEKMLSEPVSFTKVAYENGFYKLSWEKPKKHLEYIENYTLFWCNNDRDRPFQCGGYLNWIELSRSITEYNVTASDESSTQFAISVNSATSSSGMIWATCTVIHNKGIKTVNEIWISNIGSSFIELKWKLYCADKTGSIAGYIIYYCQRAETPSCVEPKNITIDNPFADSGVITGLTPYTTYSVSVAIINKHGSISMESDRLYNTTLQAAPSQPFNLTADNVASSSVSLSWVPPKEINGILRYYEVFINGNKIPTKVNTSSLILNDLEPETLYNISVSACTTICSIQSHSVTVITKYRYPGPIHSVWGTKVNNSLVLRWTKLRPIHNSLYEIKVAYSNGAGENISLPDVRTSENRYMLTDCNKDDGTYYVTVRGVNSKNITYAGPWSDEFRASCDMRGGEFSFMWILVMAACIVLIVMIIFTLKKLYVFFTVMKTVDVKLPPGLDPQIDVIVWTPPKSIIGDEEHLLKRAVTDSSGCSSVGKSAVSAISGSEQSCQSLDSESKPDKTEYIQLSLNSSNNSNNGYSMYGITETAIDTNVPDTKTHYVVCDRIEKPEEPNEEREDNYLPLNNSEISSPPYVLAAHKNLVAPSAYQPHVTVPVDKPYVQVADVKRSPS